MRSGIRHEFGEWQHPPPPWVVAEPRWRGYPAGELRLGGSSWILVGCVDINEDRGRRSLDEVRARLDRLRPLVPSSFIRGCPRSRRGVRDMFHRREVLLRLGSGLLVLPGLLGAQRGTAAKREGDRRASRPEIARPVLFDTPEADRILEDLEVFPPDNPWNRDVSAWPVPPNSRNIIASIGTDKPLRSNPDMG